MATTKWGRKETMIWPPHSPIYTYGAVFMACVLTGLFLYCRFSFGNSPLQRFYTPIYIRSSVAGAIGATRRDNYRLLMVGARGIPPRLATNSRRDRRQDAGTGRQAGPARAVAICPTTRLCSSLPRTRAKLHRCALECATSKVRFTMVTAFSTSTSSHCFSVWYHWSSSSRFPSPRTFDAARR